MPPTVLLIVDVQNGFINEWTRHVPSRVQDLQAQYDRVVATRFYNPQKSLYRKLMQWERFMLGSDDTRLAFTPRGDARIIDKSTYTCVDSAFLEELFRDFVQTVHICGIATDNCVLKCAVDLFEGGIEPIVLADACGSHGGLECHQAGLMLLRRFIGDKQVVGA